MDQITMENLAPADKAALINESISFMRTVSTIFGCEKGQKFLEAFTDAVDPVLKHEVYLAILTGNHGLTVEFTAKGASWSNAIGAIKAIRTATGLGLRETKQLWDQSQYQWVKITTRSSEHLRIFCREVTTFGVQVR